MKLTKLEIKALRQMSCGHVRGGFMPATVRKLEDMGLAERSFGTVGFRPAWVVTEAGRKELEDQL